ncbi:hypothetical protein OK344_01125 [Kaistella sp. BT6-1-3]|uniref:Thrombospondin n=1 Tax=Kaistella yananensis TaxID=2989820 RepID=A0ABT3JJ50_9FLAO|nr:hypothetical protein [Kaistella yananensis]MCW4450807.1 hypothetical protein [Kaistella yananensis]
MEQGSPSSSAPEPRQEQYIETEAAPAGIPCSGQSTTTAEDCDCDGILDIVDDDMDCAPPNPSDPIPIDDYILLLLIIAVGLIAYKTYGRKSLSR